MLSFFRIARIVVVIFLLMTGIQSMPQEKSSWQLRAKLIAANARVTDHAFSSLTYTGFTWGGGLGLRYEKGNALHEWEASYTSGELEQKEQRLQQTYFTGDYTYLHALRATGKISYHVGGSLNVLYAIRDYEEIINYNVSNELVASLSAAFAVSCSFNDQLSLTNRLQVPFISSVMQPSLYDENAPEKDGSRLNDFLKTSRLASFGSFLRIKNNLILDFSVSSHQSISLAYTWDYYQIRDKLELKQANHQLGLIYNYTF